MEESVNQLRFLTSKPSGEEQGKLSDSADVDLDIGDSDDFEVIVAASEWNPGTLGYGCRLYIPNTEYGGIIQDVESVTATGNVILRGDTWRGMLAYRIIEPPSGRDHLVLSGELNTVIRELIGDRFGGLFYVPEINTGITVSNWQVARYVTLYDALMKLVGAYGYRLNISYIQPEGLEYGYVSIQAVPIEDYSEQQEYSMEGNIHVDIRDCRNGVNHLVCAGEGENQQRAVVHLYVQEDGSIGETQHYFGQDEKAEAYIYTSADVTQLKEDGTKRLKDLMNYKKCEMTVEDIDLELGDIVSGYDEIIDTQVRKPIVRKILKVQDGNVSIDYKLEGED